MIATTINHSWLGKLIHLSNKEKLAEIMVLKFELTSTSLAALVLRALLPGHVGSTLGPIN